MGNLLIILAVLFVALFVVVTLTEKYAKPMEAEQQTKLSRIAMVLMAVLLLAGSMRQCVGI
jgi:hypothetical protein